jgi:hypothetical protein
MKKHAVPTISLLLFCLLLAGCASDEQRRLQERQFLENLLNGSIGKATYEQVLTTFGPPTEKSETSATITGTWEDLSAAGFQRDTPGSGVGGLSSLRGERIRIVFDRRTQLMKSWEYPK